MPTAGPIMEWSSENLLALSVSSDKSQQFADVLADMQTGGLLRYETGRTKA